MVDIVKSLDQIVIGVVHNLVQGGSLCQEGSGDRAFRRCFGLCA
jgi:hypothetical protein